MSDEDKSEKQEEVVEVELEEVVEVENKKKPVKRKKGNGQ